MIHCPVCRKKLTAHDEADKYAGWLECTTQDCMLMGMEGFEHHWMALRLIINGNHPAVIKCREDVKELYGKTKTRATK
jgi:hypothetical protein